MIDPPSNNSRAAEYLENQFSVHCQYRICWYMVDRAFKESDTSAPPRRFHCAAVLVTRHSVMETCFSSKKSGSSSASNGGGGESADKPELYSLVEGKLAPPNTFESKDSEVNDM